MCTPMALDDGITAPDIMLLPYRRLPATGSLIPSISTEGEKMKLTRYAHKATTKRGNMSTPKKPM